MFKEHGFIQISDVIMTTFIQNVYGGNTCHTEVTEPSGVSGSVYNVSV